MEGAVTRWEKLFKEVAPTIFSGAGGGAAGFSKMAAGFFPIRLIAGLAKDEELLKSPRFWSSGSYIIPTLLYLLYLLYHTYFTYYTYCTYCTDYTQLV